MNRSLSVVVALLLLPPACAQINVKLSVSQEQFLPAEELELAVKVSNFTGAPLHLGANPQWLAFTVEHTDGGGVVTKLADVPDSGEFTLQQATGGTLRYDLAPLFALDRRGSYRVSATVTPVNGGPSYASPPLNFDIVNGITLNENQAFGFTKPDGTVEQRKYMLQQANFLKHLRLYLRLTDATEGHTFRVISLGNLVTFTPPRWVLDRRSHLHVLHQFGATECLYHHFDPDGTLLARQTWLVTTRHPQLQVNADGEASVVGGTRRLERTDVPPPTEADLAAARPVVRAVPPSAAPTNAPVKGKKTKK